MHSDLFAGDPHDNTALTTIDLAEQSDAVPEVDTERSMPPLNDLEREALARLQVIDPDRMTPREALEALYAVKALLGPSRA